MDVPFLDELRGDGGHRARLVAAMAEAVGERGYAAATVADVVRRAHVSRRTFYEHFADRDACLLATYEDCADLLIARIARGVAAAEPAWDQRIAAGVAVYLDALAEDPGVAHVFILDVLGLGEDGLRCRRAVHGRFTDLIVDLTALHREELPGDGDLDRTFVEAMVGALNELVVNALADGRGGELREALPAARRLVRAVLLAGMELPA